ncbi:MAG: Crp/Fnr family transcriptional regulator [Ralstonia sp.]|jgi:CRP/FNR family transcriptional regulator, dissimilatory nitrate respiration regulator|uniref:Crp/Fnr family transcriptional regulator n=3 Tax=Ralstonia TaxID=48736 RepID=A0A2P4RLH5_RALPI|nr:MULTISPECIES: Crp/Fnr family transcriptional regulator [Ralstonia]HXI16943.1 Crp/Fnr family transcriptional regulator [Chloroflexota bacterium]MBA4199222.1 Crp/Fnr family transcriptional regulator [Ralstonia sp.]MBA4231918.1 Crp/Fnr family transcriptional regulator [Ralstonia sp.]MBA4237721.1 Crp/Fnr family transcriptional regulator [Ralstonia sp.]MBA4400511.1 Crp/Fnr family transcriptional regulator [Ralstonia sp.]
MQDPLNVGDLLKHSPLFLDFDNDDIALLARDSHAVRVSRHDFAFRRGDHADGFFVVVVGAIKLVLPGAHGQCKVIEFFGPGECFGEPFMFLNRPYAADAQAMEDSLLVWIGKRAVDDALHVHPRLARQMLTGLSTRLHTLMCDIETVNLQSANERLIGYLLSLPRKFDRTRFPCSKSLVASKLGLAPATLSRTLRQLIRDGLIRVEGREVVIQNTTALQRQLMAG